MTSSAEIRRSFLEYFREHGHEIVPSGPLVPANDPTLLFTNAGMVQFKDLFLGRETRSYTRAATSQRCVRAGGKHNDLENVGYTARHHTFFEMLGNFSFGDYFKSEAITLAWRYLTEVVRLPAERLWVTVFEDDNEAAEIWLQEIGVDPARFARIGAKDNFWSMGETGPCGPCTEVFYDHGPGIAGGPPGSPDEDGDRYVEIWNLVFMQYDRAADGTLSPLPRPSVDTGMGLERLAAVLQGVHSNYEIDLFQHLIEAAAEATGSSDLRASGLKVIADHIRSTAFLIVDGVLPSNEGRGYVLRRIMRRAIRHGYMLGAPSPFLCRLVAPLVAEMGGAYPELEGSEAHVARVIEAEEARFAETLDHGMRLLESSIGSLKGRVIPGETVFRLYDTYGFPVDLTADVARERGLELDLEGFEREMGVQRERARAASRFEAEAGTELAVAGATEFCGYERLEDEVAVAGLFRGGAPVEALEAGERGIVILERTPFYAESGGQVGDTGVLVAGAGEFRVEDTRRQGDRVYGHHGTMFRGRLEAGAMVGARVDAAKRRATALNHSATHLLHAALRRVLGPHVNQKGSLVHPDRLRFDFSHYAALTDQEIEEIERLVNSQIRVNAEVETEVMDLEDALSSGALALFGEKYAGRVRVLRMGEFSTELCGGTHVNRLGDIGLFKIVAETGVASGIRRIEALTGARALEHVRETEVRLVSVARLVKGDRDSAEDKVRQLIERTRRLEKELERTKARLASGHGGDLADRAVSVAGIKVLAAQVDGADAKALREAVDRLKNRLGSAAVVLAAVDGGKVRLVAGVTGDQTARLSAGELVNAVAREVGGKGGGRPDLAQAGGSEPARLEGALQGVPRWVEERLAQSGAAGR